MIQNSNINGKLTFISLFHYQAQQAGSVHLSVQPRPFMDFPRRRKTFNNTTFKQFSIVFSRQTSGMFSRDKWLLLCEIFGGWFFHWKLLLNLDIFRFPFAQSFENISGNNDWMNFDHARESHHAVTSFMHLYSNRSQASAYKSTRSILVVV